MKNYRLNILSAFLILLFNCVYAKELIVNESLPKIENLDTMADLNSVAFEWKAMYRENISGFYLYRASEEDKEFKLIATIKNKFQTHYVDTKLKPASKYFYTLKTFNNQNHISEEGVVVEVSTTPILEAVPFAQAVVGLPNKNKLVWRPHPDFRIDAYIIERSKMGENDFEEIAKVKNRLSAEFIDDKLKPNVSYEYKITALTFDNIKSLPTPILNANTKALPPEVLNVQASNNIANKIIIKWDNTDYDDFSYYKIYSTSSSMLPFTLLAQTDQNTYEDLVSGLDQDRYYKITIVDKDGLESPMPQTPIQGKTLGLPAAPSITSIAFENDGVKLEWESNDDRAIGYNVRRYGKEKAIFKEIKEKSLKDITAKAGESYTYEVIAVDENGYESKPSKKMKIK